uniref:Secreted protein n=1 Tax=Parascaris equorum TaxID=6256 RepID=A0A914RT88_PAREQ
MDGLLQCIRSLYMRVFVASLHISTCKDVLHANNTLLLYSRFEWHHLRIYRLHKQLQFIFVYRFSLSTYYR